MQIVEQLTNVVGALDRDRVTQLQQHAASSQAQLGRHDEQFGDSGVDPAYVTGQEAPPETMTHQQIWDAVHSLDQQAMWNSLSCWSQVSTALTSAFQLAGIGITRAMQGRWEGDSASAATEAVAAFVRSGERMGDVAQSVAMRMDSMFYAAQALVAAVPAPVAAVAADPDNPSESVLPWLVSGEKARGDSEAATQARNLAIAAVNTTYLPVFPPAGSDVPAFVAPQGSGAGIPDTGGSNTPTTGISSAGGSPETGGSNPESASPGDVTNPTTASPETVGASEQEAASTSGSPSDSTATEPESDTTAAAVAAPSAGTPSAVSPNAGIGQASGAGLGGSGRPEVGGLGPGSSPGGTPGVGIGVPGRSGTPSTVGTAGNASSGGGSSAGRSGPMGPMMPGAGARKRDDEDSHQSPDYLRRVQEELAMQPSAIAPVIGDAASAVTLPAPAPQTLAEAPRAETPTPRSLFNDHAPPRREEPVPITTQSTPANPVSDNPASNRPQEQAAPTGADAPAAVTDQTQSPSTAPTEEIQADSEPPNRPTVRPVAGRGPWDAALEPEAAGERPEGPR